MAKESPLQTVKRIHGSKEKLIDSLSKALKAVGDEASHTLAEVSNSKLLRLAKVTESVKERYGNRDKLVDSIANAVGRAKDSDYVGKLKTYSSGKLLDLASAAERRVKRAA